ncbi:MAG: hypothetical protein AB7E52_06705 [Bdellovibrionales bacterium]
MTPNDAPLSKSHLKGKLLPELTKSYLADPELPLKNRHIMAALTTILNLLNQKGYTTPEKLAPAVLVEPEKSTPVNINNRLNRLFSKINALLSQTSSTWMLRAARYYKDSKIRFVYFTQATPKLRKGPFAQLPENLFEAADRLSRQRQKNLRPKPPAPEPLPKDAVSAELQVLENAPILSLKYQRISFMAQKIAASLPPNGITTIGALKEIDIFLPARTRAGINQLFAATGGALMIKTQGSNRYDDNKKVFFEKTAVPLGVALPLTSEDGKKLNREEILTLTAIALTRYKKLPRNANMTLRRIFMLTTQLNDDHQTTCKALVETLFDRPPARASAAFLGVRNTASRFFSDAGLFAKIAIDPNRRNSDARAVWMEGEMPNGPSPTPTFPRGPLETPEDATKLALVWTSLFSNRPSF